MVNTKNVWLGLLMSPPILPENPKSLLYLTFSSSSRRWPSTCVRLPTLSGKSCSATRHRCSARLCCCALPRTLGHAAQDSRTPASAGCVEADRPAPAASSGRSPLLGVAVLDVVVEDLGKEPRAGRGHHGCLCRTNGDVLGPLRGGKVIRRAGRRWAPSP